MRFRVGRLEVWFDEWAARHYGGIHVRWWGRCPHRCPECPSRDITPTLTGYQLVGGDTDEERTDARPPCAYCSYADDAKTRAELAANRAEEEAMVLRHLLDNIIEAWGAAERIEADDLNKAVILAHALLARCGTTSTAERSSPKGSALTFLERQRGPG